MIQKSISRFTMLTNPPLAAGNIARIENDTSLFNLPAARVPQGEPERN